MTTLSQIDLPEQSGIPGCLRMGHLAMVLCFVALAFRQS